MFVQCTPEIFTWFTLVVLRCGWIMIFGHIWWGHQMESFSALVTLCAGNSPVTGEFPSQRPVPRSFDVFFDLCLKKKRLSKQKSWGWWFETPSCSLWRHCNDFQVYSTGTGTWWHRWNNPKEDEKSYHTGQLRTHNITIINIAMTS